MWRIGLAVVRGRSMTPTLRDGDRLLVAHGAGPASPAASPSYGSTTGWSRSSDSTTSPRRAGGSPATTRARVATRGRRGRSPQSGVLAVVLGRVWPRPALLRGARRR